MIEDRNIFIVGTGTDVGKTYVAGLMLKEFLRSGVNAGYFKAAMSGNIQDINGKLIPGDALHVKNISGSNQPLHEMCPYVYEKAYSPHLAARIEDCPVEFDGEKEIWQELELYDR